MVNQLVLLDSSVLINILATNCEREILGIFPAGVGVCSAVAGEALYLRGEQPANPRTRISLDPLIERGLLQEHGLRDDDERTLYVDLAADLDDGEAMTIAIAYERRIPAATDDRKARRIARERFGDDLLLLSTAEIMNDWARLVTNEPAKVRGALKRIEIVAQFRPPNDDPHRGWWATVTA